MIKELRLKVNFTCGTCASTIDSLLKKKGLESFSHPALKITTVKYDDSKVTKEEIIGYIKKIGYDSEILD